MKNLKIKTYHIESKSNDNGEAPIYLRVILDGKYIQLSTGIFIKGDFWDHKKKEVKSKHPDAIKLNLQISKAKERLIDIHYDLQKASKSSLEKIKGIWNGREAKSNTVLSLIEYNNNVIKSALGKTYAIATYKQYCTLKKKVTHFISSVYGKADFDLDELNLSFVTKYEHYLSAEYNNSVNGIAKQIDRLKRVINVGLQNDWLKDDPFKNYQQKTIPTDRQYLTIEEVTRIADLELKEDHLERVRDVFIFICYTGLSYRDMTTLSVNDIIIGMENAKFIRISRTKTREVCNIPLLPQSEQILSKYTNHPICQNKGILLPIISNQKMNDYLKIIAGKANIKKPITCHVGRHTFATLSLEMGVPIETVSKVLGHKSIKTTQLYGKVTNSKIAKDYSQFYVRTADDKKRVV